MVKCVQQLKHAYFIDCLEHKMQLLKGWMSYVANVEKTFYDQKQ